MFAREPRPGGLLEQTGQKRLKPEMAPVLIAMNDIKNQILRHHR